MGGCTNNRNKIERCHPWMGCEMMLDTPGYAWNICKITFFVYRNEHGVLHEHHRMRSRTVCVLALLV